MKKIALDFSTAVHDGVMDRNGAVPAPTDLMYALLTENAKTNEDGTPKHQFVFSAEPLEACRLLRQAIESVWQAALADAALAPFLSGWNLGLETQASAGEIPPWTYGTGAVSPLTKEGRQAHRFDSPANGFAAQSILVSYHLGARYIG